MSTVSITRLYDLLSAKVGKETAENLTSFIEGKIKDEFENKVEILATKKDIADVRHEIADVKHEMAINKADIMKWMFVFWIGQVLAVFSLIMVFIKK